MPWTGGIAKDQMMPERNIEGEHAGVNRLVWPDALDDLGNFVPGVEPVVEGCAPRYLLMFRSRGSGEERGRGKPTLENRP